ncbi:MAG: transglutaminase domain-containing protein, partial [Flavobacteriales bacterium]
MRVRKKNELYRITRDKKFFKPFFICINSDEVVNNKESADQLDLNRLLDYILRDKRREEERVMAILQLIIGSVEYDYDGYQKNIYANKQDDVKGILAGNKRLAVCAGYSYAMTSLCKLAGIKAEKVQGNTKQSFADLMHLGGYHAWNIIEIEGEKRLYDVTWADDGETVDMRWVDVDPLVMIGTHFPDMKEHQLVSNPISQEQFLNSPVITPITPSADPVAIHLPARQFAGNNFRMALPGKHTIIASLAPAEMAETVYSSELKSGSRSYSPKHVGSGHFDGDSTYFTIPLTEVINPFEIEIDGQIEIKTVVFKGGQSDLMKYYITKADKKRS